MKVKILEEAGFDAAMLGLSLSYNADLERMPARAAALAPFEGGHNKFLESIIVWLDINAPRYWWQQFDTYRIGVTKQSGSTMHTLLARELTEADFSEDTNPYIIDMVNTMIRSGDLNAVKASLPEGFLQRRIVCTNYKALRHIITQREGHKLPEWATFCREIRDQVQHYDYLRGGK